MSVPKARAGEAATAPASEKKVRLFMRRIVLQRNHQRQAVGGSRLAPKVQSVGHLGDRIFVECQLFRFEPFFACQRLSLGTTVLWVHDLKPGKGRPIVKRTFLSVVCLALFASTLARAQFEAGSVVGVVTDASGSVVPNASIELRSLSTDVVRQASSSSAGEFDFVAVPPGQYSITVKQTGFKQKTQDFELVVGQRLELNLPMEVGMETQSVKRSPAMSRPSIPRRRK